MSETIGTCTTCFKRKIVVWNEHGECIACARDRSLENRRFRKLVRKTLRKDKL